MGKQTGQDQAFPTIGGNSQHAQFGGLTKREYFSCVALQGYLSNRDSSDSAPWVAANAVAYADALIAELEKEKADDQEKNKQAANLDDIPF